MSILTALKPMVSKRPGVLRGACLEFRGSNYLVTTLKQQSRQSATVSQSTATSHDGSMESHIQYLQTIAQAEDKQQGRALCPCSL